MKMTNERDSLVEIEVGSKVKLLETTGYTSTSNNPTIGSKYECEGEVYRLDKSHREHFIKVRWDNGYSNCYRKGELVVIDDSPRGRCVSLWGQEI